MKAIIFLCFALIASQCMASGVSTAEILSLLQQDFTVDKVVPLLQQFKASQEAEIAKLDADYAASDATAQSEIQTAIDNLNAQVAQCDADDEAVNKAKDQQERSEENVRNAEATIASNNEKAQQAADIRCASSLDLISRVGKNQEAVEFLQYLRERVADPAFADYIRQQGGAFLQLKSALASKQEGEILSFIAKHHMLSMLQKSGNKQDEYEGETDASLSSQLNANVRTDDEIGTDYIDNDRGALSVQSVSTDSLSADEYVQLLLNAIDALINNLQDDIAKLQAAETEAVQAFIDYRRQLKDQNYVLQQYVDATNEALARLAVVQTNNDNVAAQCRAAVPPFEQQVESAKERKAASDQAYAQTRQNYADTLPLLDEVIQVYTEEVLNQAPEDYKNRADDYIDNQVFDRTEGFTDRSLSVGASASA